MEAWIEFGRGPLFRLSFALMVLGLARILILTFVGVAEALGRAADRRVAYKEVLGKTLVWLFPIRRLWTKRPFYGTVSFLFHLGLLVTPVFLAAHILLVRNAIGLSWPALPQPAANWLTLLTAAAALALFVGRAAHAGSRALSRLQDYLWPPLLAVPFLTGYLCANLALPPAAYQWSILLHIYSGCLIMALVPFTKIAHCVLLPLSQLVTTVSWKFAQGAGDRVAATLGWEDRPTWVPNARLNAPPERRTLIRKQEVTTL